MSSRCGEPLKKLMAEQNVRQRTNLVLIVPSALRHVHPTVQHVKAGKTHFFMRDPISDKADNEEIFGDDTYIHQEL